MIIFNLEVLKTPKALTEELWIKSPGQGLFQNGSPHFQY